MSRFYKATSSVRGDIVVITTSGAKLIAPEAINYYSSDGVPYTSAADIIADIPAYDTSMTIFVTLQSMYDSLTSLGFSNVYHLQPDEKITFSNGSYIKGTSTQMNYYTSDGNYVYGVTLSDNAGITLYAPSDTIQVLHSSDSINALLNKYMQLYPTGPYLGYSYMKISSGFLYLGGTRANPSGNQPVLSPYSTTTSSNIYRWFTGLTPDIDDGDVKDPDEDPYNNPGEGSFDDGSSDSIGVPSLPSLSVADTGFITLYNPSAAGLKSLANYLWSDLFSLDTFKKLFVDPMSAILGLSILPVPIPSSGSRAVTVGNVSTGVSLPVASKQFIEVNCGSITLERQSPGTYLDFSPYTKVDIYLPFIGTHPLNVDEVMGRSINVTYHVDILSGACTAYVKVGSSVLYQFIGSCAISVPITGNDWTQAINGVMNIAGAIGSMVMTGGATAPMAAGAVASTAVNSLKPNVEKSGAVSGAGGLLAVKRPYLIINRPNRNVAKNQNKYIGYPAWKTMTLGDLDGYNSIEDVHLKNIPATETEIAEIERLLKEGVIF